MKQINKSKIYIQIQKRISAWKDLQSKAVTKNPIKVISQNKVAT